MDLSDFSLQKLRLWSLDALKYFLSVRKLSVEGDFEQLVARSWAAFESDTPIDDEAEERERRLLDEYKRKLAVDGDVYPDPATFEDGWLTEETGRFSWPSIYISDISDYLKKTAASKTDLVHRLLNNYKEGKAYRYFRCEWVREILYHPVRQSAPCCILKAAVYPSMSIRNKPYRVWVMASKKCGDSAGGEIKTAHCTCPAGVLGSCNHIAGLLFRVEAAVKCGATDLRSTESLCSWVTPSGPVARKPRRWRDTHVASDVYGQKTPRGYKEKARLERKKFQPFSPEHNEILSNTTAMAQKLQTLFQEEASDSVFILTRLKQKPAQPDRPTLPQPIADLAGACATKEELKAAMSATPEVLAAVEEATRSQGDCAEWQRQRQGRITSSVFYNVHTKTETAKKQTGSGRHEQSTWLEDKVLGRGAAPLTVAMKHGLSLEPAAKRSYMQQVSKKHKKWSARDSGLVISHDFPFLASSPDLLTTCDCCGEGLCEVKCPETIKHQVPTVQNVPYLEEIDGKISLKKTHTYYGQIQGQMALTNRPCCDLFIFTEHGSLIVPVPFDEAFWQKMLPNLTWFWESRVAPALLQQSRPGNCPGTASCSSGQMEQEQSSSDHDSQRPSSPPLLLPNIPPLKRKRATRKNTKVSKKDTVLKVYRCGVCFKDISEEPEAFCDFSVKCDSCPEWYHLQCVGFVQGSEPGDEDCWDCLKCTDTV
ncbi:uncharacterized protein [Littorina saxatilis]|uniref:PHD-type domain-containing protein n=2 Tax=Littorina saxatilis TaxID=31220 RepID=A0AAN9G7B2_9CAEN